LIYLKEGICRNDTNWKDDLEFDVEHAMTSFLSGEDVKNMEMPELLKLQASLLLLTAKVDAREKELNAMKDEQGSFCAACQEKVHTYTKIMYKSPYLSLCVFLGSKHTLVAMPTPRLVCKV